MKIEGHYDEQADIA